MENPPKVVHAAPLGETALMPCCGRDLSALQASEQVTTDQDLVTCTP